MERNELLVLYILPLCDFHEDVLADSAPRNRDVGLLHLERPQ